MGELGKATRLNRILAGRTRRVLTVAVDHMINYPEKFPQELRRMASTLEQIILGEPDAVTMNKGAAIRLMAPYAGRVPLIIQSMALRPHEPSFADTATVEETLGLGADAIAVAMFVYGETELAYLRHLAEVVRSAAPFGLPVIPHIYPLESGDEKYAIVHDPEHVHYAARVGFEMGADVVKVPYTGDIASFRDIVEDIPVPVLSAGGPRCDSFDEAVALARDVGKTGAAGATMGRNVWGFPDIPEAIRYLKEAINEA